MGIWVTVGKVLGEGEGNVGDVTTGTTEDVKGRVEEEDEEGTAVTGG
jgi:hypothetical protein